MRYRYIVALAAAACLLLTGCGEAAPTGDAEQEGSASASASASASDATTAASAAPSTGITDTTDTEPAGQTATGQTTTGQQPSYSVVMTTPPSGEVTGTAASTTHTTTTRTTVSKAAAVRYLASGTAAGTPDKQVSPAFRTAMADWSLSLLRRCGQQKKGSMLVSPLSVMTALAMTANGADGATRQQMRRVLGGSLTVGELNRQLHTYYAGLTDDGVLQAANALWVSNDPGFTVNKRFLRTVQTHYNAAVIAADLAAPETLDAINGWCSDNTHGMIPSILNPDDLTKDTLTVLLNALCFEALWSTPYRDDQCRRETFHGAAGNKKATMMHGEAYTYLDGKNETGFMQYYQGGRYAFLALLPRKKGDIQDYLDTLDGAAYEALIDGRQQREVLTRMPQFKLDYTVNLNEVLTALGMDRAFDPDRADFTRLGTLSRPDETIYLSKVLHKTHIEVTKSGTRAAAVTAVVMNKATSIMNPDPPPQVILNRPFVYAIVDTATFSPLFMGVCTDV